MVDFVKTDLAEWSEEKRRGLPLIIAALSAEAELPASVQAPADPQALAQGRALLSSVRMQCATCHTTRGGKQQDDAPTLL
jgi:mono/diheme cytochrome c family protein